MLWLAPSLGMVARISGGTLRMLSRMPSEICRRGFGSDLRSCSKTSRAYCSADSFPLLSRFPSIGAFPKVDAMGVPQSLLQLLLQPPHQRRKRFAVRLLPLHQHEIPAFIEEHRLRRRSPVLHHFEGRAGDLRLIQIHRQFARALVAGFERADDAGPRRRYVA